MMRRPAIVVLLSLIIAIAALPQTPASAGMNEDGTYPMVFPVQGANYYSDTFGDPRSGGRSHAGTDIMSYVKGVPVVAVADGVVRWTGSSCCYMAISHDDGWESWYIHLNNDTQNPDGTYSDDGLGWGFAPGIEWGVRVKAGQLIGWTGDSGNAEWTGPHLHFELRDPSGAAVSSYDSLRAAIPIPPSDPLCPDGVECDSVAFQDAGGEFDFWADINSSPVVNSFFFGNPGDVAFSGDWDCDGVDTLGLYRTADGFVYLRNANSQGVADITFYFGNPGDMPVAGDFNGDGCDTVSLYRPSEQAFYISNALGEDGGGLGAADYSFMFGNPGDKPFVGDFDGDGTDSIGLHRESTGLVYFRNSNSTGVAEFQFIFGDPGDVLFAGDWDGDGDETVGVYRSATRLLYLRNSNTQGNADATFYAGSYTGVVVLDG